MKKIYFLLFGAILVCTGFKINAQVYTGGSMGIHYDDGIYVDAAPLLGYRQGILDLGVAPFYAYREYDNMPSRYSYGNRLFMQLTFIPNVILCKFLHNNRCCTNSLWVTRVASESL